MGLFQNVYKKRLFYIWLLSYVLILIIPLLIAMGSYISSRKVISKEIELAADASLNQVRDSLDSVILSVENICNEIELNQSLTNILYNSQKMDSQKTYEYYQLINRISSYGASNQYKEQLVFYVRNGDSVFSKGGMNSLEGFLMDETIFELGQNDIVKSQIENIESSGMYGVDANNPKREHLLYYRPMPSIDKENYKAIAIMFLNVDELKKTLNNAKWYDGGQVVMLRNTNEVLLSVGDLILTKWDADIENEQQGVFSLKNIDGKEYYISYKNSKYDDYTYLMLIPKGILYEKLDNLTRTTMFYILLASLLGIVLAFLFARKSYLPIQNIMSMLIESGIRERKDQKQTEMVVIKDSLVSIMDELDKSKKRLNDEQVYLKESFLRRVFLGKYQEYEDFDNLFKLYEVNMQKGNFVFIAVAAEETQGLVAENEDNIKSAVTIVLRKMVSEELESKENVCFEVWEMQNIQCILLSLPKVMNENAITNTISELYESLMIKAPEYDLSLTCAASLQKEEYSQLMMSYREAYETLEYAILINHKGLLSYNEMQNKQERSNRSCYDLERENMLASLIRSRKYDEAYRYVDEIFAELKVSRESLNKIRCTLFSIVNTIINAIPDNVNLNVTIKELMECERIADVYEKIQIILKEASKFIELEPDRDVRIERIIKYIHGHYTDVMFNVTNIAYEFDLNLTYMSKLFHEKNGQTILEYIHKLRIEKVKELLEKSTFSIKEISQMVGFQNSNACIRVFKKYEKLTPGQYRKLKS